MEIGYIGLGKMGSNHVKRLHERGHRVVAWNRSKDSYGEIESEGIETAQELSDLTASLEAPRVIWIMVTHSAVDAVLEHLTPLLDEGDVVIDGGNSYFKDTLRRGDELATQGVMLVDAGVSGGPNGARNGSCIMIGADDDVFTRIEPLFRDSAAPNAYQHMGERGSGHYTKMVHNGIEYGMMQAIAEGMNVLRQSQFSIRLTDAARIYNQQSVIESRLIAWAQDGFETYGEDLQDVTGSVGHTGEAKWTVDTAHEMEQPVPIIEGALRFREESEGNPSYIGKILSMLRNMFGGHSVQ